MFRVASTSEFVDYTMLRLWYDCNLSLSEPTQILDNCYECTVTAAPGPGLIAAVIPGIKNAAALLLIILYVVSHIDDALVFGPGTFIG